MCTTFYYRLIKSLYLNQFFRNVGHILHYKCQENICWQLFLLKKIFRIILFWDIFDIKYFWSSHLSENFHAFCRKLYFKKCFKCLEINEFVFWQFWAEVYEIVKQLSRLKHLVNISDILMHFAKNLHTFVKCIIFYST